MSKVWFVTGSARGIGAEIVRAALAAGDRVVATGRDAAAITAAFGQKDGLLVLRLDVTNNSDVESGVAEALSAFGRIDILVNNAGYGQMGVFEESDPEDAQRQFATNVFGVFNVTRAVLPAMRQQRSGHIFNISSIAGMRGGPGGSLYCASKHALEGFSESLSHEVTPFGIRITVVEPGFFRTDFLDASSARYGAKRIGDYAELSASIRAGYEARNHRQVGDPAKLGAVIVDLASREAPPFRFAAGSDAVEIVGAKIDRLRSDLDAWRSLSVTTDGDF